MIVSEITVSTKSGRAAMYTILVTMATEDQAASLAHWLETEVDPGGVRRELHVWRPSDSPMLVDVYTFDKATAETAHSFLTDRAAAALAAAA
jgi:hypothetical protein